MVNSSTLLFIMEGPDGESDLINANDIFDFKGTYSKELDRIFSIFDYSPSDEVITLILKNSGLQ